MKHTLRLISFVLFFLPVLNSYAEKYSWQEDLNHRLRCDFTQDRASVVKYIRRFIPNVTDEQIAAWEASGALEFMELDGEKRYFYAAGRNLFRIDPECSRIWGRIFNGGGYSDSELAVMRNMPQILRDAPSNPQHIAQARRMRVTYTLTVDADAVPAGEKIRCWLPYPRQDHPRQTDVTFISANQSKYRFSDPDCEHSTLYMEQVAVAGQPTVFKDIFEYTSHGQWFELSDVKSYDTKSKLYKKYTSERDCHIVFTQELRALADSLTRGMTNPVDKARSIFCYVNDNFPWASAREYSTIPNIPMYVLQNRHGDCGQVSLLFITLCRISGIPAHFQSGFMMHPWGDNLHDWAEVYFEGIGWVPVDQSFGVWATGKTEQEKMFFFGGIDSWRMIVNSDYGMPLSPKKKYPRSETVDFQRGEVEWKKGNLYFDKWDWNLEIQYLD